MELPKKKLKFEKDKNIQRLLAESTNNSKEYVSSNEFDLVNLNIVAKLSKMHPTQQIRAELLIHKILVKGLLGELTSQTDVLDANFPC